MTAAGMYSLHDKYCDTPKDYILSLVPEEAARILDVGCGAGATGRELKSLRSCEIIGVEIDAARAARAESRLDKVLRADIETENPPFAESFDCVICADVLEHLRDPWATVRKLHGYLRPGGCLVASLPNVRHWRVVRNLALSGRWDYEDSGIMDRDHLRFFTRSGIFRMAETAGFMMERTAVVMGDESRILRIRINKARLFNAATLGLFESFLVHQYILRARKKVERPA